jgi:hypothetical protein
MAVRIASAATPPITQNQTLVSDLVFRYRSPRPVRPCDAPEFWNVILLPVANRLSIAPPSVTRTDSPGEATSIVLLRTRTTASSSAVSDSILNSPAALLQRRVISEDRTRRAWRQTSRRA